jgi:chaperonin GroEL (HSP60 family)
LVNAASVAGLLLTTDCAIYDLSKKDESQGAHPGMGMM